MPTKEPIKEPNGTQSTENQPQEKGEESSPSSPPTSLEPKTQIPTKCHDGGYQEKNYRLNRKQFVVATITLIILFAYTTIAAYQARQMRQATEAARKSADAAEKAARTADETLRSSQISFQIDQRPYVIADGPPQFVVSPNALGKQIEANVILKDIGRTPAINSIWFVDLLPYRAKSRPEYLSFLESSYLNLRKRKANTIEKHSSEMSRDIAPTAATFSSEQARSLSASEMRELEKGDGSFILLSVGIVDYTDALKGSYETEFCYYFVGTDPRVWHICDSHNTIR